MKKLSILLILFPFISFSQVYKKDIPGMQTNRLFNLFPCYLDLKTKEFTSEFNRQSCPIKLKVDSFYVTILDLSKNKPIDCMYIHHKQYEFSWYLNDRFAFFTGTDSQMRKHCPFLELER